jgi:cytidylate kinase
VTSGRARVGPIITLDGPAGSGKSTTAREVARRLGYRHLDSGAFYRALTFHLLEQGVDPERWSALRPDELAAVPLKVVPTRGGFEVRLADRVLTDELRTPEVTGRVAYLAGLPQVRRWLIRHQHDAARHGSLVADGRDMGTVVFPDADLKFYLTADLQERARRRLRDHGVAAPSEGEAAREAERIAERDRTDSQRELSPLRRPDDAIDVDTTALGFEEQVDAIVERIRQAAAKSFYAE